MTRPNRVAARHDMQLQAAIGGRVERLRSAAGMTQVELSERTGIPRARIWQIETAKGVALTVTDVARLAEALGVTPGSFFGEAAQPGDARRAELVRGIGRDLTSALHRLRQLYGIGA